MNESCGYLCSNKIKLCVNYHTQFSTEYLQLPLMNHIFNRHGRPPQCKASRINLSTQSSLRLQSLPQASKEEFITFSSLLIVSCLISNSNPCYLFSANNNDDIDAVCELCAICWAWGKSLCVCYPVLSAQHSSQVFVFSLSLSISISYNNIKQSGQVIFPRTQTSKELNYDANLSLSVQES